ncbi:molybdopterin-guanine dinucleotide biosynthesis protein B [Calidifontibacillus erzurumensis]|uniref:Molybdopterin-guanine dinucleotide biosynthesis protein B n=1 Tax=Calidifontibacillus erzurumensis TaxID=2741433 RepID=A0A8J8KBY3_9BACI|nr:molybdopterin-guanine dinucleotide biosynthesis protein B [Calidifontibacillus erzurumensis]NSL51503.1 molybdopterin-guanine dinucleotide biosynthesis protein B [Calidifontibacillus erzurumensis]
MNWNGNEEKKIERVLQIVGYQNSGKTTLMEKLIASLTNKGFTIGTIKHHGHGGFPKTFDVGKDTDKHRKAGAAFVSVEGDGLLQIQAFNRQGWTLEKIVSAYNQWPLDIILIEGYKQEPYPKIVLLRTKEDEVLLKQLTNIKAVICWYKPFHPEIIGVPAFHIDDENDYIAWIISYFERIDSFE